MTLKKDIRTLKGNELPRETARARKFKRYPKNLSYDSDYVYSYGTPVAKIENGTLKKLGYWSVTTSKHINYAGQELGLKVTNQLKDDIKTLKGNELQKDKWISSDGWRGYTQKAYSVAGSSDTGMWSDSPAPSNEVRNELKDLQKYLKERNIDTNIKSTQSSNAFMIKQWITTRPKDYEKGKALTNEYLNLNKDKLNHLHNVD